MPSRVVVSAASVCGLLAAMLMFIAQVGPQGAQDNLQEWSVRLPWPFGGIMLVLYSYYGWLLVACLLLLLAAAAPSLLPALERQRLKALALRLDWDLQGTTTFLHILAVNPNPLTARASYLEVKQFLSPPGVSVSRYPPRGYRFTRTTNAGRCRQFDIEPGTDAVIDIAMFDRAGRDEFYLLGTPMGQQDPLGRDISELVALRYAFGVGGPYRLTLQAGSANEGLPPTQAILDLTFDGDRLEAQLRPVARGIGRLRSLFNRQTTA